MNRLGLVSLSVTGSHENSTRDLDFQSHLWRGLCVPTEEAEAVPDVGFWEGAWGERCANWM